MAQAIKVVKFTSHEMGVLPDSGFEDILCQIVTQPMLCLPLLVWAFTTNLGNTYTYAHGQLTGITPLKKVFC